MKREEKTYSASFCLSTGLVLEEMYKSGFIKFFISLWASIASNVKFQCNDATSQGYSKIQMQ